MGRGGECLQMLPCESGVGDIEKFLVPPKLLGEVAKTEDVGWRRRGGRRGNRRLRAGLQRLPRQQNKRDEPQPGFERTGADQMFWPSQ